MTDGKSLISHIKVFSELLIQQKDLAEDIHYAAEEFIDREVDLLDGIKRLQEELKKRTSETSEWGEKQYVNGWNDALANAEVIIDLRAENERLKREAEIRLDQLEREQEAHLKTMAELNKAADEIERLREALKPFARHFEQTVDVEGGDTDDTVICGFDGMYLRIADLRAAKAALGESDE